MVTGFFVVEVLCGLRQLGAAPSKSERHPTAVIIIPAHDEEAVIEATVRDVRLAAGDRVRILVVADNCADRTAELARSAGANLLIRNDPVHRGKGYALAAARDDLRADPPEVVMVLDADCRIDRQSLDALVSSGAARPSQAVNLLAPDLKAAPLVQVSSFAFLVKNLVRQRGLQRLAGRVHLTGTGMALPWDLFARANLGGSNIVEDLALGLDLAGQGTPPTLVERAMVWSPAASAGGTLVQRHRWEGGFLSTMVAKSPAILARSIRRGDVRGLCAALDLCVPPLALLATLNLLALTLGLFLVLAGAVAWPVLAAMTVGLFASGAVVLAWLKEGRRFASAGTLARVPLYVLWKLPMYVGLVRRGAPKDWLRTGR